MSDDIFKNPASVKHAFIIFRPDNTPIFISAYATTKQQCIEHFLQHYSRDNVHIMWETMYKGYVCDRALIYREASSELKKLPTLSLVNK